MRWGRWVRIAWRWIGGEDRPGRRAIPAGELFHPATLAALALLVVNDRVLKGSAAPGWLSGKLSDLAGLASFPLVATAAVDTVLWGLAALGVPVDFTLRRWKLAAAIALTGAGFAAMKLSSEVAAAVAAVLDRIIGGAHIVADPSDLLALPALALAAWIGRAELRRVPLGRVEWMTRRVQRGGDPAGALADTAAPPEVEAALVSWARGGPAEPAATALARHRS